MRYHQTELRLPIHSKRLHEEESTPYDKGCSGLTGHKDRRAARMVGFACSTLAFFDLHLGSFEVE